MRVLAIVASLAVVALSNASSLPVGKRQPPDFPDCAKTCIASADIGSCSNTEDFASLCRNGPFIDEVTSCVASACNPDDFAEAAKGACARCADVGVTLPFCTST